MPQNPFTRRNHPGVFFIEPPIYPQIPFPSQYGNYNGSEYCHKPVPLLFLILSKCFEQKGNDHPRNDHKNKPDFAFPHGINVLVFSDFKMNLCGPVAQLTYFFERLFSEFRSRTSYRTYTRYFYGSNATKSEHPIFHLIDRGRPIKKTINP